MPTQRKVRQRGFRQLIFCAWLVALPMLATSVHHATANEPRLSVTQDRVSCTDTVTLHGTGFIPGSDVIISNGGPEDVPFSVFQGFWGPIPTDDTGSFTVEDYRPSIAECIGLPSEPILITASTIVAETGEHGQLNTGQPMATVSLTFDADSTDPWVSLSPAHGTGCEEVSIHGENFLPGSHVFVTAGALGGHVFAQVTSNEYPTVRADGSFDARLPHFASIVGCGIDSLPHDGNQYIVGAQTGRPKHNDDPGPEPSAATVFTIALAPADRFGQTWDRTDAAVADGTAARTWIWGPAFTKVVDEPYVDSPGELRKVQYFDKARMEINDPGADRTSPWYVTNGLLVVEMVEGTLQLGDSTYDATPDPAEIPIAGDAGSSSPTYAEINRLGLRDEPAREPGAVIDEYVYTGQTAVGTANQYAAYGVTAARFVPQTSHTIASVFWEFMNSETVIQLDAEYSYSVPLFEDPFYATGLPITEAYWTTTLLRGEPADILWQCFERRCLTYTPVNAAGWQVEAGNVGQHYYEWRYAPAAEE